MHKDSKTRSSGIIFSILKDTVSHARLLSCSLLLVILGSIVFALLPPLVLEKAVNGLTGGQGVVLKLALLYFAILIISALLDAGKEIMITVFGQKVTRNLRHSMCGKLTRLPADYFTAHETGKITSRFVNDVDTVEMLFEDGIISMFADACEVTGILIMVWIKSPGLGILLLIALPLIFLMTRRFQKRMLQAQKENRAAVARVHNHIPETIRNIRMIHSFSKEAYMEKKYDSYIQESYDAMEKSNFYDAVYSPIINVISAAVIAVMMVMASAGSGMRSLFGISVGTAVAIIAYVGKVFDPIESIGMEIENIQSAVAGAARIREFLQEPERKEQDPSITADVLQQGAAQGIVLDEVSFGYNAQETVLQDLSLQIRTGENVTLTGRTGAGKSTLFRLLLGLYSPDRGSVRVFGQEAAAIPDSLKRKLFGYVEQTFEPVAGTIAEQISLFDDTVSRDRIEAAAKLVGIHEVILQTAQGYDTPCRDCHFSMGQLQLLSIARAVADDPQILLLDETTASLDTATQQQLMAAFAKVSRGRTVLSILHRTNENTGAREIRV